MKKRLLLLLPLFTVVGCTATRLDLPSDPVRMTIIQRQAKTIPGSRNTVKVQLGDITGKQVLLSIRGGQNQPIVDTRSVEEGDRVAFDLKDGKYTLRVVELRNLMVGDDFGVFEVSTRPEQPAPR